MPPRPGAGQSVLRSGGVFILEFANKLNLKAIVRYLLGRQKWSPFTLEPVEFAKLNFDFHPKAVRNWLKDLGFTIEKTLTLSHFRVGFLKADCPNEYPGFPGFSFPMDRRLVAVHPSVFVRARRGDPGGPETDQGRDQPCPYKFPFLFQMSRLRTFAID